MKQLDWDAVYLFQARMKWAILSPGNR